MTHTSSATGTWRGTLGTGTGSVDLTGSRTVTLPLSWEARIAEEDPASGTTTPEELLASALAGSYAMTLANALATQGISPEVVTAGAEVEFDQDKGVTGIDLTVIVRAEGLVRAELLNCAERTKRACPIARVLHRVPLRLSADLA
ncbi:OsmC family protein [Brevibacterium sp. 50QC2O2]|jgi:osmotically inducible protein OsmC|uniref:OsmC family protein n=1 Tax=Brevibacterium sp. 50QC2O2 TaxID=2968459 RepID=UPI00211C35BB|nr:OsmC family protein [Brevibacterium sp. 50QC2O2]MCQ9389150.1 OsmC family protein [Brevibacterium sp. 50QC2O2]